MVSFEMRARIDVPRGEREDQRVAGDREDVNVLQRRAAAAVDPGAGGVGLLEVREAESAERVESAARLGAEHAVVVPVAAERPDAPPHEARPARTATQRPKATSREKRKIDRCVGTVDSR